MKYEVTSNGILLFEENFDPALTLDCGQAFRWEKCEDGSYFGYYLDKPLKISGECGKSLLHGVSEEEFLAVWKDYFDLDTDYAEIKLSYSFDPTLAKATEHSSGLRLLRQDPWETLVSFIFSQNNNIPRIKGIISRLVEHYGHFPTAKELEVESTLSLGYLRCGFRAKYILDAAKKVATGEVDFEICKNAPFEEAKKELIKILGVGPKVADCVLLYGFYRTEAFPVDVWIKRVLERYYLSGFPKEIYKTGGIAQLYLFNYIRTAGEED